MRNNSGRRELSLRLRPWLPRAWTVAGCALAMGLMAGSVAATPGSGVSSKTLAQGVTDSPVEVKTTGATDDGTCTVITSVPGDAFVEESGDRHVHNGRNLGKKPVVLHATYILPKNSPVSVDAKDPGC